MTPDPKRPYKAIVGFLIAFIGALVTAITQEDVDALGWAGWVSIIATALLTALGVYQISNPDTPVGAPTDLPPQPMPGE